MALVLGALMGFGARVPRAVLWAWNILGIACLAVVFGIAILAPPIVRFFGDEPPNVNSWVLFFPYVWLPAVLVVVAIAGPIVVTRRLIFDSIAAVPQ